MPEKLNDKRRYDLESPANEIFLSSISIVELMIKHSIGKININFDPLEMAQRIGLDILSFSGTDAITLGDLPLFHKDPFDRMIIAQAINNSLNLMSDDSKFIQYKCNMA